MPYAEYLEWQEFYALEPWGLMPQDVMHAHSISVLANVNRDSKRRPKPYRIDEFLLYEKVAAGNDEPILLDDPNKQTEAMISAMFSGMKVIRADSARPTQ